MSADLTLAPVADVPTPAEPTLPAAAHTDPDTPTPAGRTIRTVTITGTTRRRRGIHIPRVLIKAITPVALIALWQLAASAGWLSSNTLASPEAVVVKAGELIRSGELGEAIVASGQRVGAGLAIGLSVALVAALVSGLFRRGEDVLDAPIQMLRTVPVVGLIPLLIIWFGIGEEPKIILIALGVFFPFYLNTFAGIRSTDPQLIEAGRTLGLGRLAQIRHVVLPSAVPNALVGLRYSIGVSWLLLVFAETINATSGIGYLINTAREFFETDTIVLCLVLYALLGLIADIVVRTLERMLLQWRPTFTGT